MAQPPDTTPLDDVDVQLLEVLANEGRIPNNALAARVGIAPSTCLNRVRALVARGVIRGFGADIDPTALGHPIQAIVMVSVAGQSRERLSALMDHFLGLPGVLRAYLLGGQADFALHVAVPSVDQLHTLVIEQLSSRPEISATETNLVFKYARTGRIPFHAN